MALNVHSLASEAVKASSEENYHLAVKDVHGHIRSDKDWLVPKPDSRQTEKVDENIGANKELARRAQGGLPQQQRIILPLDKILKVENEKRALPPMPALPQQRIPNLAMATQGAVSPPKLSDPLKIGVANEVIPKLEISPSLLLKELPLKNISYLAKKSEDFELKKVDVNAMEELQNQTFQKNMLLKPLIPEIRPENLSLKPFPNNSSRENANLDEIVNNAIDKLVNEKKVGKEKKLDHLTLTDMRKENKLKFGKENQISGLLPMFSDSRKVEAARSSPVVAAKEALATSRPLSSERDRDDDESIKPSGTLSDKNDVTVDRNVNLLSTGRMVRNYFSEDTIKKNELEKGLRQATIPADPR